MTACSETDEEVMWGSDGEEQFYVDFKTKKGLIMLPPFANPLQYPGMYEVGEGELAVCKKSLARLIEDFENQLEPQDAPQSSIYPSDDIQLGSENMLICHFTQFFPPPVTVRWTKNGEDVTDKSTLSQFYPNEDNTFNQFSHLPFIPQEGDIYTCTVEHKALETPDTKTLDGHLLVQQSWCFWSKDDLSDMEYIKPYIFNKINYVEFNSTLGRFVGYTETGIYNAEEWNKDTAELQTRKAQVENYCRNNAQTYYSTVLHQTVEPRVKVKLVKKADGSSLARLMCSAYSFYPRLIKVTWLRNNKEVKGGQTSTEEMPDGDWYYQIHSHLEYMPESGEEISCVVEHASFKKPMVYKWDPSMSEPDKSKIAIGASGLVLGVVLSAAGFIYYRKRSSGQ
ncbi:DLA class II histocompatibility antigen, DR-1 beta chain [Bagarius yarrelli]|uniref:DLA class II histocompatibility antigen, DR-1 beta chain n=1 Tax=Bagarius yarrelli TaxID=175774 RepID=A0A556VUF1_BAGYA|nr:DLA class II histocompatibility antigen, DR-1 beta chain [Bagarius yarrelli]